MNKLIGLGILVTTVLAQAAPDSCDDYASRHYQKDLIPAGVKITNVPRSGDLGPWQVLELTVQNTGSQTIEDNSAPGSLVSGVRQLQIGFTRYIKLHNFTRPVTTNFTGFMKAPLAGGQRTTVSFTLPANFVKTCDRVTITVDNNHQVGQWGCAVFGNDKTTFYARLAGSASIPHCITDIIHH